MKVKRIQIGLHLNWLSLAIYLLSIILHTEI